MGGIPEPCESEAEARAIAADRIRYYRQRYKVTTLEPGSEWEVQEPDDCAMVPDSCGTLAIRHITWDCRECGHACETKEDARECCAETFADDFPDYHDYV